VNRASPEPSAPAAATGQSTDPPVGPALAGPSPNIRGFFARLTSLLRPWAALICAVGLAFFFRLPPLLNAASVSSDGMIVGLQGMHILKGEWSPLLWGTEYQASLDSFLAAALFAVGGARPVTLLLVPVLGALVMVGFAFDILRRRTAPWTAFFAVMPLSMATMAINQSLLHIMRQSMISVLMVGLWLLDGAHARKRPLLFFALGGAVLALARYVDSFALIMAPACGAFGLACCFDKWSGWKQAVVRALSCLGGAAIGSIPAYLLSRLSGPGITLARVIHEFPEHFGHSSQLMLEQCLPFALGYKVFVPGNQPYPDLWTAPLPVHLVQLVGAALFGLAELSAIVALFFRRIPWKTRRLGLLGPLAGAFAMTAFAGTGFAQDMWGARYLAPLVWMAPFAFASAAWLLRKKFALVLAPYFMSIALAGWMAYGPQVSGPFPARTPRGMAVEEMHVAQALRERGIHYGTAQYWVAYRLTFIFHEDPILVPLNPGEDRYKPYRDGFNAANKFAMVFHPSVPWANPTAYAGMLDAQHVPYERLEIDGFTVLIVDKTAPHG
jgi:hypothetical protein